jgi:excisionase family DNA binding protein
VRHELMTPTDVAKVFGVTPKTVSRWARAGKIESFRTVGGHLRFRRDDVVDALRKAEERFSES